MNNGNQERDMKGKIYVSCGNTPGYCVLILLELRLHTVNLLMLSGFWLFHLKIKSNANFLMLLFSHFPNN